jgi:hypothetical protein
LGTAQSSKKKEWQTRWSFAQLRFRELHVGRPISLIVAPSSNQKVATSICQIDVATFFLAFGTAASHASAQ